MASIKDWVLSQVVSKAVSSTRPLSASETFISDESPNEEIGNRGMTQPQSNLTSRSVSSEQSYTSNNILTTESHLSPQIESSPGSNSNNNQTNLQPLGKVEALQINFLRTIKRLGLSQNNLMVAKVLYRIHLATLIRAEKSDLERANLKIDRARLADAEEENCANDLDFSLRILVLGKTGVGKSSTINSIFGESKAVTDAFKPGTDKIQEIVGFVNGVKISFIDTPGLLPSSSKSVSKNRKILHSVKKFIRKSRPDVILYFERLDLINTDYSDFPLLKLVTEILGPEIWFSTSIVMTHSSAALPEGQNGYSVNYESYVNYCTDVVQRHIHLAVSDSKLENPVILVENRPNGNILPNGTLWASHFMLLCVCTKVLGDVNMLLEFKDGLKLGPSGNNRIPSLPHLLSSFLKHQVQLNGNEIDELSFSDMEEEEEYDELPPIRILSRAQFKKLSSSQKSDYLDELDYRETLYLKKQLKEHIQREKNEKLGFEDNLENQESNPQEAVMLPEMAIPPSFDSNSSVHRFRCLVTNDQWLARPVLDPHGWDHDVGFDGINLEVSSELRKNLISRFAGQMSKDKQDFNVQSESTLAFLDPGGPTYSLGLDFQSSGKDLITSFRGNTKIKNFKRNVTECGILVTSFGEKYYFGGKIEDTISINKRLEFKMNAGRIIGAGQLADGGSFEATFKGKDYPVRDDKVSLLMTILSFNKEPVFSGNVQSDFRLNRSTKMSVNANINSRKMGQVSVKLNSSEHMEIALIAAISVFRSLLRKKSSREVVETQ